MTRLKKATALLCTLALSVTSFMVSPDNVDAAKKIKLSKTKLVLTAGNKGTIKLKNATKKTKVTWKTSNKKVLKITRKVSKGKKAMVTFKVLKKGTAKLFAAIKGKKKLVCKVTVKAKKTTNKVKSSTNTKAPSTTNKPVQTPTPKPAKSTGEPGANEVPQRIDLTPVDFQIIKDGKADVTMYIDEKDSEYDGISLVADTFKSDVARVIGENVDNEGVAKDSANGLTVVTDASKLSKKAIIAGTFGDNGNALINKMIADKKIDVSKLKGRWESYLMQVVKNPCDGVDEALVIAGSDKRGTLFGIFSVSELIGVSPWVWWSDVIPAVQKNVTLQGKDCNYISKEPSVKYRGIFLNDESPSLTGWTQNRYKGRNEKFYKQVYELLLRSKANYLWPAMWSDVFSENGSSETIANAKLADQYGIVMGTSHHEPCYRAGKEWHNHFIDYRPFKGITSAKCWNSYNLPGAEGYDEQINASIEKFWADGIARNKDFEGICTVGMRGEDDSELPSADNPPLYAQYLNHVISTQKKLISEQGDKNPTQLVIYKEVENAWYAGNLFDQDCMKGTYAMFCDDNWSYLRTLPTKEQQKNVAGLGMYYHFDYVGAPKSYTWIQTVQLSKIWDQMSVAYDHGVDDVWIANVGDLKPMEQNISYFLDLGYDYEKWGKDGQQKIEEYKKQWIEDKFVRPDGSGLSVEDAKEAATLIDDYLDLETERKVEHILYKTANSCSDMFSVDNYNEAERILIKCNDMMDKAIALEKKVPDDMKAAFYQLVYYPAMAVPNVIKIQIYAALNQKYAKMGLTVANKYAELCNEAIKLDDELTTNYNKAMPGNIEGGKKWSSMMSAGQRYHIGMELWNTDSGKLPELATVTPVNSMEASVLAEQVTGSFSEAVSSGELSLPAFTNNNEAYTIALATKGGGYTYTATASEDWINISKKEGKVTNMDTIEVTIDFDKLSKANTTNPTGTVTIKTTLNTVVVNVKVDSTDLSDLAAGTYVMANGYAAIDVVNNSDSVAGGDNKFIYVPDNGKFKGSVRTVSSTTTYEKEDLGKAPYVEYKVYVPADGDYILQSKFNPTCNLEYNKTKLRYGISVDGAEATITNSIVDDYLGGTWQQGTWAQDIEKNDRQSEVKLNLKKGSHTIRYYQMDPNMALIRMVLSKEKLAPVYSSPAESFFVGKSTDAQKMVDNKNRMYEAVK